MDNDIWPLIIVSDRYNGSYSSGRFTAWNLESDQVPTDIYGCDTECCEFWRKNDIPVGLGTTIQEAIDDLAKKLDTN